MRWFLILLLASLAGVAAAEPPAFPKLPLDAGEKGAGQGGDGKPIPPLHWTTPTGQAVALQPLSTAHKVVLRAAWNDGKPHLQTVASWDVAVDYLGDPFYNEHPMGQLVVAIQGMLGGVDHQHHALRLQWDAKQGFKIVKRLDQTGGLSVDESFMWDPFKLTPRARADGLGRELRLHKRLTDDSGSSVHFKRQTGTGKTAKTEDNLIPASQAMSTLMSTGAVMGLVTKCNEKQRCCTADGKSLTAWEHVERVCYNADGRLTELLVVAPR